MRVYKLLRLRAPMSRGRGEGVRWQSSPVHVMIALFRVVPDVWRARKLSLRLFACLSFRARARAHAHTHTHTYIHTCMHACMHTYDPGRGSRALTFEHVCRRIRRVRTRRRRRERLMRTLTPRTLTQRSSLWDFFVDSCSELLFCARISVCWA